MMNDRPSQKDRTGRAFAAYLTLVDTADWIRRELRGPLESFGVTMEEFRLMLILHRDGKVTIREAAERRSRDRKNLLDTILALEKLGLVRKELVTFPPAEIRESRLPKAMRGGPRVGRRAGLVSLTAAGTKFVGHVLPKQAKLMKSYMRVLNYRQQRTLIELCLTLRKGDVLKFISEITHRDADEED